MFSNEQGAEAVVDAWYEEVNNIVSYDPYQCESGAMCGHFTALVWTGVTEIGCGCVHATNDTYMYICRYKAAGDSLTLETPNMNKPSNYPSHVLPPGGSNGNGTDNGGGNGPAPATCTDTDGDAVDPYGDGCEA